MDRNGLKISHVVGTQGFAGLERYVVEVATEQSAKGHDVQVLGGAPETMRAQFSGTSVTWMLGGTPGELVRSLVNCGRRDIVHSHITRADYCASATAPITRASLISTRHIVAPRGASRASRALSPVVRRRLAAEIAVSEWTNEQLSHPADRVLLNGVRPTAPYIPSPEPIVLMAHRLAPEKDTTTGLRAWAQSGLAEAGWTLEIAGAGPERRALEVQASELGVEQSVRFLGWVANVDALFRRARILLAPAPAEPCGLTILEAMAMGLPVVAAASGGHLETVGSITSAALFTPADPAAAAGLLSRLANDDDARNTYGRALLDLHREHFTLDAHVERLLDLYSQVAKPSR